MNSMAASLVIIPGVVALLLFLVFSYLYEQSRQQYFRAWQIGWGAYTLHYALDAWAAYNGMAVGVFVVTSLLLVAMAYCIFVSTRLMRERFRLRNYDAAIVLAGVALIAWNLQQNLSHGVFHQPYAVAAYRQLEVGLAALLLYCSFFFYHYGHVKNALAFKLLSMSVALWAVLMGTGQFHGSWVETYGGVGHLLGPIPQMLLGISMVMVLFENERDVVQENSLAFSTLGMDLSHLFSADELKPSMQDILERLLRPLPSGRAVICISERWRTVLPSVEHGFGAEFIAKMEKSGASEYICELAYRRGGFVTFNNVAEMGEPLPVFPGSRFHQFRQVMGEEGIRNVTAVSLQTRENNFGVVLFPHSERRMSGASNLRLLTGLALQIGLTLENYVVMHNTQRRTKEYELLTQIGQAISSHLNQDEVLRTIQKELGQIFDTTDFYIAFLEGDEIRFEYEVEGGQVLAKRRRKAGAGLTEYVIRTGQPLLIRSDLEEARKRLNVTYIPPKAAKSFCAAPILLGGRPAGVMAVRNTEREFVFEQQDLEVMQTAAGQVSVAVENARLFAEEQRRSRQLAFLNNISKTAISSEDAEQMLNEIVAEIQKNFRFEHIGIGIFDYATKDIEIKAEAGITAKSLGRRIPLGTGIVGRVARTGEDALLQAEGEGRLQGILPDARSVLCIPINYGESLMGVLNVESPREDAFTPQDVLIMKTLADLLATALHNAFVFQKLQQQSITDGLTGIKTRRFFWEALSSEWKRASRSGRPFSVVLVDLDKFKEVNDSMGHLEGDLVLARVGRLLEQKCRQSNVVARYGGDEFIILMPETGVEQAQVLAERLRLWLATDPMMSEHGITGSFGVASFPVHGYSAEDLIRQADAGMYISKHAGGDRVSSAEEPAQGSVSIVGRQMISGYIEGFLQREHTGPEHLEELISTLKRLASEDEGNSANILREAIEALAHAAEAREGGNAGHGEMTARYCEIIGRALQMPIEDVADLAYAARVHDVGQLFVPERILNKPGPLSEDEFYLVKVHPRIGAEILGTVPGSEGLSRAIEHHHEAFDGSGYPAGLRGEEIPLWARILSLADAYVNMTTDRSFASARSSEEAMAELEKLSGIRYDGMLVRILARELKQGKPTWSLPKS
jgi:diguanylate cyclase (GGDEF)-like protein